MVGDGAIGEASSGSWLRSCGLAKGDDKGEADRNKRRSEGEETISATMGEEDRRRFGGEGGRGKEGDRKNRNSKPTIESSPRWC